MAVRGHHVSDGLDEGGFAGTRHARDADPYRFPRTGQAAFDDFLRLFVVFGPAALDERDGLRQYGDVAREDALHVLVGGERGAPLAVEVGIYGRLGGDSFRYAEGAVAVLFPVVVFPVFGIVHCLRSLFDDTGNVRVG